MPIVVHIPATEVDGAVSLAKTGYDQRIIQSLHLHYFTSLAEVL